jgi:EmrB/QacA subfamily drug resistance transporter
MKLTYRWRATLVIALGLLMAVLDTTIVSVVLPQMALAFKTDYDTITWVGTGYLLANAAIIPIVGYLSDRVGAKTLFLISLAIFTLGSVLCAVAPNQDWLIAFRIFQGLGGGALQPLAMAMIFRLFAPSERAGAMTILMIPLLLGPAFGPALGGYLATSFSWNAIFTINVPIGIVAILLSLLILKGKAAERAENGEQAEQISTLDPFGLGLSMAGFAAFVYSINAAGLKGWNDATVLSFLIGGGVLLIAFVIVELRVKDPVMDLRLFRHYSFTMANLLTWFTTAILIGSIFLVPFFFEQAQMLSALTTGEILISQGLVMIVGLAIGGKLYNTVGPRILSVVGIAIVAVSLVGFTNLTVTTTGADVQIWLILSGIGLGLIAQPMQTLAVSVVSNKQMATASSLMSSTRMIFGAVGVAVLTTYLTQQTAAHAKDAAATCLTQLGLHAQALQLHTCLTQHALTMGMNDTFRLSLICCIICAALAIFLGRDPALEAARAARKRGEYVEEKVPASIDD